MGWSALMTEMIFFLGGETLFWTTRAPVSSTFLMCWSTFEVVIIPICFGRYRKWRQKFYDMKIVRYIQLTTTSRKSSELFSHHRPLKKSTQRFLPNNGPPTASLAWLPGLRVRALLVLLAMLGLWPLDQLISVFRYGPFKWSDWGWTFQYDLMALGGDEWRDELLQMKCEKFGIYQRSPYDPAAASSWFPGFFLLCFSFHVQGCQVACQTFVLLAERQKGVWVDFCVEIL